MKSVAIIDYGVGNLFSLYQAVLKVGAQPKITRDRDDILRSDCCILPGVGAFASGMMKLKEFLLDEVIYEIIGRGKFLLGICLGAQLLMDYSEEFGYTNGLHLISGHVEKINCMAGFKIPYVGWGEIMIPENTSKKWRSLLFKNVLDRAEVYFVNSYAIQIKNPEHQLAVTDYGGYRFCSAIVKENVFGCQFHPEKSGLVGLSILRNFVEL